MRDDKESALVMRTAKHIAIVGIIYCVVIAVLALVGD